MSLPSQMKAVVTTGDGNVKLTSVLIPKPGPGQILVKVVAAAQNPSEWMKIQGIPTTDIVVGHDYAGLVQEIGPGVPAGIRQIGQRVAGFVNACISNDLGGTFAEYTLADAQVLVPLPEYISFEDAATLGLAGFTACQALWQNTPNVPTPDKPSKEPNSFPVIPEHYELGKKFGSTMSRLLRQLKGNPVKLVPNGLTGAQEWIEYQQAGKVSAEKFVYRIADTA